MGKPQTKYEPISPDRERELLHLLASCGFIGNQTRTAQTHAPVNPPNFPRLYHELRDYFGRQATAAAKK